MRLIQAPGIQTTELDRSGYADNTDNSIVNTASFFCGFTDKGIDYEKKYVNSMNTFVQMFGAPTNEAERYLYNGVYETINRGGNAYVAKLPYDNNSLDCFAFTKYCVLSSENILSSPYDVTNSIFGNTLSNTSLYSFILKPNIDIGYACTILQESGYDQGILTELREYLITEDSSTLNLIEYFDKCNITLTVITDMFEYMSDIYNFQYSTKNAIQEIFYRNNSHCRNDGVYMLQSLYEKGPYGLSAYNIDVDTIRQYESDLNEIRDSIVNTDDGIQGLIEKFGKNNTLKYYVEYFYGLSNSVDVLTCQGEETRYKIVKQVINEYENREMFQSKYTELKHLDDSLTSYVQISSYGQYNTGMISLDDYDKFKVGLTRPAKNDIHIIDIKRNKYNTEANIVDKMNPKEYLGILPVITTAANAIYVQNMLKNGTEDYREYCAVSSIHNVKTNNVFIDEDSGTQVSVEYTLSNLNNDSIECVGFSQNIGGEKTADESQQTISKQSVQLFPFINFENGRIDRKYCKQIGVVVCEMYADTANNNKIGFSPVEAYVGSLNRKDIDSETKASIFIDTIVNTNSSRINFFSNVEFTENQNIALKPTDRAQIYLIENQNATSLGFYSKDTLKKISLNKSILKGLDMIFFNAKDINTFEFDILVDAGVSNIAQFIRSVYGKNGRGYFDLGNVKASNFQLTSQESIKAWSQVLTKYDDLCKNVRKDCMFIADGLRSLCLIGNEKRVRNTRPENTIENTILKDIKYMSGIINSSYGAGYCDWFYTTDRYTGDYFWCPPSIKANGIYIYTDAYSNYWDATAGMNRGVLPSDVVDVAFNPTIDESGRIYNNQWNYAISYPINGIVQEGQKTFQKNKTALDRVNVRRLMLGLEKRVRYVAKYFTYEGITDYMMMRFSDSITNILQDTKNKGGILDFYVICDSRNNNVQTVENNELHCTIAVKPVKSIEFILINFIATSQGANVQEVAESEL